MLQVPDVGRIAVAAAQDLKVRKDATGLKDREVWDLMVHKDPRELKATEVATDQKVIKVSKGALVIKAAEASKVTKDLRETAPKVAKAWDAKVHKAHKVVVDNEVVMEMTDAEACADSKDLKACKAYKAILDPKVTKGGKAGKEFKALGRKEYKAGKECKVYKGYKAFKAHKDFKAGKASLDSKACKAILVHKVSWDHKASMIQMEKKILPLHPPSTLTH
ncbi:MAG TPA: hypothetical protein VN457_00010 [Chlamydiales bacterium]|jgi:hypothetical protein|nr:hypothetical protein [Chlamydiales bacterium]